jgi:hypothetical protein
MANYQEKCEHCGNITTAYAHKLNKPLVSALRALVDFYEINKTACNLQKNLDLTKNQYNNFQKLQYFFLVRHTKDGWYPTPDGIKFIYSEIPCLDMAMTLGRQILNTSHVAWKYKRQPRLIFIKSIDECSWKKREEYQDEKRNTLFDN